MSDASMHDAQVRATQVRDTPVRDAARAWVAYDFAVLRAVPHPHVGAFVPVGVVVHARTAEFLRLRAIADAAELARRVPDVDAELLARYLRTCVAVCDGDAAAGPIALVSPSERFHWITAPRSDVLQSGPVHEGVCVDPARAVEELYAAYVGMDRGSAGDGHC